MTSGDPSYLSSDDQHRRRSYTTLASSLSILDLDACDKRSCVFLRIQAFFRVSARRQRLRARGCIINLSRHVSRVNFRLTRIILPRVISNEEGILIAWIVIHLLLPLSATRAGKNICSLQHAYRITIGRDTVIGGARLKSIEKP